LKLEERGLKINFVLVLLFTLFAMACLNIASMPVEACRPPTIKILSPKNMIYATNSIPLIFTVDKPTSWIGYTLDGQANITISGNTTLDYLEDGWHYVIVYANDTYGRMGASCKVCFAVDTTPPNITDICQLPEKDNVFPDDDVMVNATVTDEISGVKQVTLFYAYANESGIWIRNANMTNIEGDIWSGTIPKFPYCTNVTYTIMAEDNVGNTITTVEMGYDIQYQVIPEFPALLILPLTIIATLLTSAVYIRKKSAVHRSMHTFKFNIRNCFNS